MDWPINPTDTIPLAIGKIPNNLLSGLLSGFPPPRAEVLTQPSVGEDCAVLDFGTEQIVVTTDPITGATSDLGKLAVHVSLNDLASAGAEPVAIFVTLLCPPGTLLSDVQFIMKQMSETCHALNLSIAGGHTEVTDAVNRTVVSVTALGKTTNRQVVLTTGSVSGDALIMTKSAGLEGTAILADTYQERLSAVFSSVELEQARALLSRLSVLPEGLHAVHHGARAMHDVTEGGVLGAAWEMAHAAGIGLVVQADRIPVLPLTRRICETLGMSPLRLIGSGSLLISAPEGDKMVQELTKQGIEATIIGHFTPSGSEILLQSGNQLTPLSQPDSDELFREVLP